MQLGEGWNYLISELTTNQIKLVMKAKKIKEYNNFCFKSCAYNLLQVKISLYLVMIFYF
jgi:hypothetical protein